MPTFNKGIFRGIEYEAKPIGKLRTISQYLRWYRPYAPGATVDFDLILRSLDGKPGQFRMYEFNGGVETENWSIASEKEKTVISIRGRSLSGQGALDFRFGYPSESDSQVVVSVVASHNDALMFLILGVLLTCIVEVVAIVIAAAITKIWGLT